jgi:hypothetical protein
MPSNRRNDVRPNSVMRSLHQRIRSQRALRFLSSNSQQQQHVVVISGASSGIGEEIALKYAKKHSKLILGARRVEKLAEVAERCVSNGASSADVIRCDVSQENDCKSLIAKSMELHGRIDVLVLNAGVGQVNTHTHTVCLYVSLSVFVSIYPSLCLCYCPSFALPSLPLVFLSDSH